MARPWKIGDLVEWRRKKTTEHEVCRITDDGYPIMNWDSVITPAFGDRGLVVAKCGSYVWIVHMFASGRLIRVYHFGQRMRRVEVSDE